MTAATSCKMHTIVINHCQGDDIFVIFGHLSTNGNFSFLEKRGIHLFPKMSTAPLSRPLPLTHRRTGTFRLGGGGAVTVLPKYFLQFPNAWLLKSRYKRTQIAQKKNSFTIYRVAGNFRGSLISRILDFFRFRGKKSPIWISDFTRVHNFSRIPCTAFESNKNGRHMVVFVTLFATFLIEVQQWKKGVNFWWIIIGGRLFSRDLIIRSMKNLQNSR